MPPNPLTSFEIQTYQNEPKFNGLYSRSSLPKIKYGAYVINFDEYNSIEPHQIAFYVHDDHVTYLMIDICFDKQGATEYRGLDFEMSS